MQNFKIMNVLLSDTPQFLDAPSMLVRSTQPFARTDEQGVWQLSGPGKHDFMTFFNALSVGKWLQYTVATEFFLHLELRGAAAKVVQTHADALTYYAQEVEGSTVDVPTSGEWQSYDLALTYSPQDVLEAFTIETTGATLIRNSYYYTKVDESQVRNVELAIATTTFKKESYIEHNIELVKSEILGTDNLVAEHLVDHVVDNGRTLDVDKLQSDRVRIHPNDNAGGAGGYARGMIEAMEQTPRATHVLLMDDDVIVSPESIIRTYNLLCLVNDKYQDAFVSGAMMNMDEPYVRWEEMGFIGEDGAFHPIKPVARMNVLHDVVANETFDIPSYLPDCEDQEQHYAAWWYCVIPLTQVDAHGLPLPIFVRGDDVEYSRRCKPEFITMNGICIWHMAFHMRYNAAQERYQMVRNCFIDQAASDFAPLSDFRENFIQMVLMELRKFNYENAELAVRGLEDFLRGPDWIMQPVAQKAFMDANRDAEKTKPLEEVIEEAKEYGVDLVPELVDWRIYRDLPLTKRERALFQRTMNGNRFDPAYTKSGKVAVIDNVGWAQPWGRYARAEIIISIDLQNHKGVIRRIDRERFRRVWDRYRTALRDYDGRKSELEKAYREALPTMTSVPFWKHYLGLDR